jgi:hypothetical protein
MEKKQKETKNIRELGREKYILDYEMKRAHILL